MNQVEKLIWELCPEGVEYRPLLEVSTYVRGLTYAKHDEDEFGALSVLRANNINTLNNRIDFKGLKKIKATVKVNPKQRLFAGDILMCAASGSKSHVGKVAYFSEDQHESLAFGGFMSVIRAEKTFSSRFLFHILTSSVFLRFLESSLNSTTINNISAGLLSNFRVPVPPLDVQQEIVRILDTFTELEAELEAELEVRKKQYEHYRNSLLTFLGHEGVRWVPMGELVEAVRPAKSINRADYGHVGQFPIIDQGQEFISGYTDDSNLLAPVGKYVLFGDHTRTVKFVDFPFAQGADGLQVLKAKEIIDAKFLFHAMSAVQMPNRGYNRHWSIVKNIQIPVPALQEQVEIVKILDYFHTLVADGSTGLPAEIDARRKQYEYYRNQLLTLKELVA
jgi:type I restriction enzyme S subunit